MARVFRSSDRGRTGGIQGYSFHVQNFGPITDGELPLRPLTILTGPNNSGKSYAALLIHSFFHLLSGGTELIYDAGALTHRRAPYRRPLEDLAFANLQTSLREGATEVLLETEMVERIARNLLLEKFGEGFRRELESVFSCSVGSLVRQGSETAAIVVTSPRFDLKMVISKEGHLEAKVDRLHLPEFVLRVIPATRHIIIGAPDENPVAVEIGRLRIDDSSGSGFPPFPLASIVGEAVEAAMLGRRWPSVYLPAARSGILLGHKALTSSFLERARYAGFEEERTPRLPGTIVDLLRTIYELPVGRVGPLDALATEMERDLVKGQITLSHGEAYAPPEVQYRSEELLLPLHRTASSISELAPVLLYLRYVVQPGAILIIEEPEAHLHPENQRIFANYLARLVNSGVNILITTHSDFLINQINNYIRLKKFPEAAREMKVNLQSLIPPSSVSALVFPAARSGKSISPIDIDAETGIHEQAIARIQQALYNEAVAIDTLQEQVRQPEH